MLVRDLIYDLSRATKDSNNVVIAPEEWLQIIIAEVSQLEPEVLFEYSTTINWTDCNTTTYEYDCDNTSFPGIEQVKTIYLIDTNGEKYVYDNWIFDKDTNTIRMDPDTYKTPTIFPGDSYPTLLINWTGHVPDDINGESDIHLERQHLSILRKICIKEALRRILVDQTKFDRFRTLVNRVNEYALIAMIRDYSVEIENDKKKLANANTIRTF